MKKLSLKCLTWFLIVYLTIWNIFMYLPTKKKTIIYDEKMLENGDF